MASTYIIAARRSHSRAVANATPQDWHERVRNTEGVTVTGGPYAPTANQLEVEADEGVIEALRLRLGSGFIVEKTVPRHPLD